MRLVCTLLLFSALGWAQAFQGSLRGRVTDPKDCNRSAGEGHGD